MLGFKIQVSIKLNYPFMKSFSTFLFDSPNRSPDSKF